MGEVHVWRASLGVDDAERDALREALSPDELERAAAFRMPEPAHRFIVSRGILRRLLARYGSGDAGEIALTYGEEGKPAMEGGPLHFNVSHCGDTALYAFARHGPVGVDLEAIRPIDAEAIARRFFTAGEHERLRSLGEPERVRAFFRYWTRKEAWAKARGVGLWQALKLDALELEGPQVGDGPGQGWTVRDLELEGMVATLVGPAGPLRRFRWQGSA